jgi:RNA polymerase sigma-70 factor (ECF subfamily)
LDGFQLRDPSKVKSWLFTTLHRAFLETGRRQTRFPHFEFAETDAELPVIVLEPAHRLDALKAVEALGQVDEVYRAPVALFYLEDCSYQEIADILEVPIGTVKSRISRGLAQLKEIFSESNPVRYQPGGQPNQSHNRVNPWAALAQHN